MYFQSSKRRHNNIVPNTQAIQFVAEKL